MTIFRVASYVTAAACGLSGGVLFAFSAMVMPSLGRLPAEQAVRTMQVFNLQAPRSTFMLPLLGSAVGCLALGGYALLSSRVPGRPLVLTGSALGIAVLAITMAYHVPRNGALALVDATGSSATTEWAAYAPGWTAMNHVRAAAGLVAAVLLVAAARVGDGD